MGFTAVPEADERLLNWKLLPICLPLGRGSSHRTARRSSRLSTWHREPRCTQVGAQNFTLIVKSAANIVSDYASDALKVPLKNVAEVVLSLPQASSEMRADLRCTADASWTAV